MTKTNKKIANRRPFLPHSLLIFFAIAALLLVPWSFLLWQSLPPDHLAMHWNIAWAGFDISLLLALGLSAFFGLRKSGWVIIPATIAGTLLFMDAWFDYLTAKRGWESGFSLFTGLCIEVPISLMAFWLAYKAGTHYIKKK